MPIFGSHIPTLTKEGEETKGPDQGVNYVILEESISLKRQMHSASCASKIISLTSAKLNSLHSNIEITAMFAVNLTISISQ